MRLTLITTGGTLDGTCHDLGIVATGSALQTKLEATAGIELTVVNLFNKDSRDLEEGDRMRIVEAVAASNSSKVLIGHGTYTICETGSFLKKHLKSEDRSVLLVGAWIPLEHANSDADKQICFALTKLKDCSPGIFVAMDGRLWNPDRTEKQKNSSGAWEFVECGT